MKSIVEKLILIQKIKILFDNLSDLTKLVNKVNINYTFNEINNKYLKIRTKSRCAFYAND